MVFKQDINRIEDNRKNLRTRSEDVKSKDKDDKGKEPLHRPTEPFDTHLDKRKPSKIEVD